jgi:site-specific DNA-cytosine methylase
VREAAHGKRPNIVFLSAPCKGFSGLLSESRSTTDKYQALNRLTLRGVWLMLEAWADDPPEVILFENVPRIATRGRHLLDQITGMLRHYGYVVRETTHDCGELGELAQSRKRFLLIARHAEKIAPFIYEPPKRPLRAVGEILDRMHLPGDMAAGPMHRIPGLNWKTWVRLAFVQAGKDWRSLNELAIANGHLRDYLIVPTAHNDFLGVREWDRPAGTITSRGLPSNGAFSIADPRAAAGAAQYSQYGVLRMEDTAGAIIGVKSPGQGVFSVADPRHGGPAKHSNEFRIIPYDASARAVTGAHGTGQCVADPRPEWAGRHGHLSVAGWSETSRTVTAGGKGVQGGYPSVADPRPGLARERGDAYLTAGHYGVVSWDRPSGAVSASACHDNGSWSVADPRSLPALTDKLVCRIRALDGTWHRPFTTLELAALQSIYDPDDYAEAMERIPQRQIEYARELMARRLEPFVLHGTSDQAWRERIGNAVPKKAAKAMAEEIGRAILLAWAGESFQLSNTPIWVRPIATALAVRGGDAA